MTDMFRQLDAEWTTHLASDPRAAHGLREVVEAAGARTLGDLEAHVRTAGALTPADAELIARSRIAGHRIADIATHHGLQPRTLWDRRQRAEHTLATHHTACA